MNFNINAIFCGLCGNKAVISQDGQARLVNYYSDVYKDLRDSSFVIMSMACGLDQNGSIWIKEVKSTDPE